MKMLAKRTLISIDSRMLAESCTNSRLVIDIREPISYEKSHIKDSVNLLTSSLLLRRLQRGSLDICNLLPQGVLEKLNKKEMNCDTIVVYDEDSSSEIESKNIAIIGNALKKGFPKKNIFFLNGGFNKFCTEYPTQCVFDYPVENPNRFQISLNTQELNDPTDRGTFSPDEDACPVEILPYLYLGSAHHSSQKEILDKLGVTAILNVSRTCPMVFQNNYTYKTIPVDDNHTENISSHFDEAIDFIDSIKSKNGIILVHCRAGISRSATICIAYLMRKYGYTLDQAYEYTKKRRTNISPNFNFLGQLLTLEKEVKAKQTEKSFKSPMPLTLNIPKMNSLSIPLESISTPLTGGLKSAQLFTYSPKSCMNFFGNENIAPSPLALLTPS